MKELVLTLLKAIPDYLVTIGQIITSPRKFVLEKSRAADLQGELSHALLILGISLLIAIGLPGAYKSDMFSWHLLGINALYKLFQVIVGACVLWLSWRIVG